MEDVVQRALEQPETPQGPSNQIATLDKDAQAQLQSPWNEESFVDSAGDRFPQHPLLKNLPAPMKDLLRANNIGIREVSDQEWDGLERMKREAGVGIGLPADGAASLGRNRIDIRATLRSAAGKEQEMVVHEAGHLLDKKLGISLKLADAEARVIQEIVAAAFNEPDPNVIPADNHRPFLRENNFNNIGHEAVAQAFAMAFLDPRGFAEKFPAAYEFLKQFLTTGDSRPRGQLPEQQRRAEVRESTVRGRLTDRQITRRNALGILGVGLSAVLFGGVVKGVLRYEDAEAKRREEEKIKRERRRQEHPRTGFYRNRFKNLLEHAQSHGIPVQWLPQNKFEKIRTELKLPPKITGIFRYADKTIYLSTQSDQSEVDLEDFSYDQIVEFTTLLSHELYHALVYRKHGDKFREAEIETFIRLLEFLSKEKRGGAFVQEFLKKFDSFKVLDALSQNQDTYKMHDLVSEIYARTISELELGRRLVGEVEPKTEENQIILTASRDMSGIEGFIDFIEEFGQYLLRNPNSRTAIQFKADLDAIEHPASRLIETTRRPSVSGKQATVTQRAEVRRTDGGQVRKEAVESLFRMKRIPDRTPQPYDAAPATKTTARSEVREGRVGKTNRPSYQNVDEAMDALDKGKLDAPQALIDLINTDALANGFNASHLGKLMDWLETKEEDPAAVERIKRVITEITVGGHARPETWSHLATSENIDQALTFGGGIGAFFLQANIQEDEDYPEVLWDDMAPGNTALGNILESVMKNMARIHRTSALAFIFGALVKNPANRDKVTRNHVRKIVFSVIHGMEPLALEELARSDNQSVLSVQDFEFLVNALNSFDAAECLNILENPEPIETDLTKLTYRLRLATNLLRGILALMAVPAIRAHVNAGHLKECFKLYPVAWLAGTLSNSQLAALGRDSQRRKLIEVGKRLFNVMTHIASFVKRMIFVIQPDSENEKAVRKQRLEIMNDLLEFYWEASTDQAYIEPRPLAADGVIGPLAIDVAWIAASLNPVQKDLEHLFRDFLNQLKTEIQKGNGELRFEEPLSVAIGQINEALNPAGYQITVERQRIVVKESSTRSEVRKTDERGDVEQVRILDGVQAIQDILADRNTDGAIESLQKSFRLELAAGRAEALLLMTELLRHKDARVRRAAAMVWDKIIEESRELVQLGERALLQPEQIIRIAELPEILKDYPELAKRLQRIYAPEIRGSINEITKVNERKFLDDLLVGLIPGTTIDGVAKFLREWGRFWKGQFDARPYLLVCARLLQLRLPDVTAEQAKLSRYNQYLSVWRKMDLSKPSVLESFLTGLSVADPDADGQMAMEILWSYLDYADTETDNRLVDYLRIAMESPALRVEPSGVEVELMSPDETLPSAKGVQGAIEESHNLDLVASALRKSAASPLRLGPVNLFDVLRDKFTPARLKLLRDAQQGKIPNVNNTSQPLMEKLRDTIDELELKELDAKRPGTWNPRFRKGRSLIRRAIQRIEKVYSAMRHLPHDTAMASNIYAWINLGMAYQDARENYQRLKKSYARFGADLSFEEQGLNKLILNYPAHLRGLAMEQLGRAESEKDLDKLMEALQSIRALYDAFHMAMPEDIEDVVNDKERGALADLVPGGSDSLSTEQQAILNEYLPTLQDLWENKQIGTSTFFPLALVLIGEKSGILITTRAWAAGRKSEAEILGGVLGKIRQNKKEFVAAQVQDGLFVGRREVVAQKIHQNADKWQRDIPDGVSLEDVIEKYFHDSWIGLLLDYPYDDVKNYTDAFKMGRAHKLYGVQTGLGLGWSSKDPFAQETQSSVYRIRNAGLVLHQYLDSRGISLPIGAMWVSRLANDEEMALGMRTVCLSREQFDRENSARAEVRGIELTPVATPEELARLGYQRYEIPLDAAQANVPLLARILAM
ncbi:MAG: hypothetical protein NC930_06475, partial [Candidatus Omnitrophica bacterium]|nr:hypothetical protein [Candidatus Omnitrophota bacterium]